MRPASGHHRARAQHPYLASGEIGDDHRIGRQRSGPGIRGLPPQGRCTWCTGRRRRATGPGGGGDLEEDAATHHERYHERQGQRDMWRRRSQSVIGEEEAVCMIGS